MSNRRTAGLRLAGMAVAALVATSGLGLLGGCATPERAMNPALRQAIEAVEPVLLAPQTGLDVTVQPTDGGQGGLLGVLVAAAIDAKREESACKHAAPILEALQGHDFRGDLRASLDAESARGGRLPWRLPWRLETTDTPSHRQGLLQGASAGAVLLVAANHRLEGGNLILQAEARLYGRSPALLALRPQPNDREPLDDGNVLVMRRVREVRQAVNAANVRAQLGDATRALAAQLVADLGRDL